MSTVAGLPEEIRVKVPAGRANYYPHFKEVCEVLEQHLNEMKMHFDQRLDSIESQVSNLEQGLMLLGRDFLQSQPSSS